MWIHPHLCARHAHEVAVDESQHGLVRHHQQGLVVRFELVDLKGETNGRLEQPRKKNTPSKQTRSKLANPVENPAKLYRVS